MDISVIICTYNRQKNLKCTLDSLLVQKVDPELTYEIILVDNNSTDNTKALVESYMPSFKGRLRYIFEKTQGKSYALNKGLKQANGEIIAFTDDDVIVHREWVKNINISFTDLNCHVIGGKILPKWHKKPSSWLTKRFYGCLALLDYGSQSFKIESEKQEIYGANFCIKKRVFDEIGNFNTNFGPKEKALYRGEDSDLFFRLLEAKKEIYYNPKCIVYHKIESDRVKRSYFRKWKFYSGKLEFRQNINKYRDNSKKYPFNTPYWLYKKLLKIIMRYLKLRIKNNKPADEIFEYQLEIFYQLGIIFSAYDLRRS